MEKISQTDPDAKHIFTTLKINIIPQINKLGIETFIVPLPLSDNNMYWQDYPPDYIANTFNKEILDIDFMYFVFYLNKKGNQINFSNPIKISFSELDKDTKIKIINIFEKYLFGYFTWTGSNKELISIDFVKAKNQKLINQNKIKQDDTYPILKVNLQSKINFIQDKTTLYKLVNFFENLDKKYLPIWSAGASDFEFIIYSFNNDKNYLEKMKKFIKSIGFITKGSFILIKNENSKEKIIWEL